MDKSQESGEGGQEREGRLSVDLFDLPTSSPVIELDLVVSSAYSADQIYGSAKIVAKLEAVIHTLPEKLKGFLIQNLVGGLGFSKGREVKEEKEGELEEYRVTQTVKTRTVRSENGRREITGGISLFPHVTPSPSLPPPPFPPLPQLTHRRQPLR